MDGLISTIDQDGYAQVLVVLEPCPSADACAAMRAALAPHFLDPGVGGDWPSGATLAGDPGTAPIRLRYSTDASHVAPTPPVRVFPALGLALGLVDRAGLSALADRPGVRALHPADVPAPLRPIRLRPAVGADGIGWGAARLGADRLWAQGFRGQEVLVGLVDTGVDGGHSALAGAVAHFTEFDLGGDQIHGTAAWDADGQGTHAAGLIAARPGPHGAFGLAPEAQLACALASGGGQALARLLGGLDWAVARGARIVTGAIGGRGQSPALGALVTALHARDVLPVFAAGDDGPATSSAPGNRAGALSVGAIDGHDEVAVFSGSQRFADRSVPDVVAPGVALMSCVPGGGHAAMTGTSVAAAQVAGLAALLRSAVPDAPADAVAAAIRDSARLPSTTPAERAGHGIPYAPDALARLRAST